MKALVVCARRYNGHELWTTLGTLQEAGIEFEVTSTELTIADEVTHQKNVIERTMKDIDPLIIGSNGVFQGVMFISGNMQDTELHWMHPKCLDYVHAAYSQELPLAAICCSTPIIREAVKGRTVSCFPLNRIKEMLEDAGATISNISISCDGSLLTAEHQMASQKWASLFVQLMKGEEPSLDLADSGFVPTGKTPRKPPKGLEERQVVK